MKKRLIKTSHYLPPEAREEIQRLAQVNARSAGWIVRKCVEFGLAHAGQIDFHAPEKTQLVDTEFRKALDDFFGDQRA
jgi:predicted DNA-binding protein